MFETPKINCPLDNNRAHDHIAVKAHMQVIDGNRQIVQVFLPNGLLFRIAVPEAVKKCGKISSRLV